MKVINADSEQYATGNVNKVSCDEHHQCNCLQQATAEADTTSSNLCVCKGKNNTAYLRQRVVKKVGKEACDVNYKCTPPENVVAEDAIVPSNERVGENKV